jgi:hypothetical protein
MGIRERGFRRAPSSAATLPALLGADALLLQVSPTRLRQVVATASFRNQLQQSGPAINCGHQFLKTDAAISDGKR